MENTLKARTINGVIQWQQPEIDFMSAFVKYCSENNLIPQTDDATTVIKLMEKIIANTHG